MGARRVAETREAVILAADAYAIAEGSGGDTSRAVADLSDALDEFEGVVRADEIERARKN